MTPTTLRLRFFSLILMLSALPLAAQNSAATDPVLRAMREEMDRSKAQLKLDKEQPPYYIEYSITDQDSFNAEAAFGALRTDLRTRARLLRVMVRVGSYKQDNSTGRFDAAVELAPVDDDLIALRHQIWIATDAAYKRALETLAAKQAMMKQFESEVQADDFAKAPAVESVGPLSSLGIDAEKWKSTLVKVSALYRKDPQLQQFTTTFRAEASNVWFLNSEGTVTRHGRSVYLVNIAASAQAADGMRLDNGKGHSIAAAAELPTEEKLLAEADALIASVRALREAPVVEDQYRGPVLFSADASTDVFQKLLAENVLGVRPRPGETARTTGAFANDFKARVLPEFASVVDDPTKTSAAGRALIGAYTVDDEGVTAVPVTVVEKGILVGYLMSRQPIRDFPTSNGHGRASAAATARAYPGNLFVSSSAPLTADALRQKFLAACKDRGAAYCYRVESVTGRLLPRLLYRVYVNDGHEELVRGAKIDQLDTRSMRSDLAALGDDMTVSNNYGQLSDSVIAPSALFSELEIKRENSGKDKLPAYPAPPLAAGK